ncbi:MAG: hypothetical protein IJY09_01945 [Lachnospiraceae bacterium]|nr:hypothetical protein [Lachnospiraceae bacterium]
MKDLEKLLIDNKPIRCEQCGGKLFHIGSGKYQCEKCEHTVSDDFGKVKEFLETHGPAPAIVVVQETGVREEIIEMFLKKGRLEIVEGSKYYLKCEKCGCSIRSGRFCLECARELAEGVKRVFYAEVGDKPKQDATLKGKMHFIKRK